MNKNESNRFERFKFIAQQLTLGFLMLLS